MDDPRINAFLSAHWREIVARCCAEAMEAGYPTAIAAPEPGTGPQHLRLLVADKDDPEVVATWYMWNTFLEVATTDRDLQPLVYDEACDDPVGFRLKLVRIAAEKFAAIQIALVKRGEVTAEDIQQAMVDLTGQESPRIRVAKIDVPQKDERAADL